MFPGFNNCHSDTIGGTVLIRDRQCSIMRLPIGIHYDVVCGCEYPSGSLLLVWINEQICRLYGPNWLPNSMLLNQFWTTWILDSCSCGWSINVLTTFCNSTCLAIVFLMWKGTKGQSMITFFLPHIMHRPMKITWSSPNPQIHDHVFWLYALFDPTLDSFDKSMIVVLHLATCAFAYSNDLG